MFNRLKSYRALQDAAAEKAKENATARTRRTTLLESMLGSTTKQIVWFFSINGAVWIWCSYILAFLGRDQIAESLSSTVCTIVIGQMIMYIISKTVENVSKYNPRVNGEIQKLKLGSDRQTNEEGSSYGTEEPVPGNTAGSDPGEFDSTVLD